jgi:dTDP-4-dehydrorhamnose 3,5-epimerase-like enzyme
VLLLDEMCPVRHSLATAAPRVKTEARKLKEQLPPGNPHFPMEKTTDTLWKAIDEQARSALTQRDYRTRSLAERLSTAGVEAGELIAADRRNAEISAAWIPGVELFARRVYPQRHRGFFGEFARQDEGALAAIGFWPRQWATARMFAGTAKGFHIHPPFIPDGEDPARWFKRLFIDEPGNYKLRPYAHEQWDVMFFVQGTAEMLLVDERAGMERRVMRFLIEGDDLRGANNAGVVIPAGVAHALRSENSSDLIMVYGTSTKFNPAFEGRIASGVESAPLPPEWERYIAAG